MEAELFFYNSLKNLQEITYNPKTKMVNGMPFLMAEFIAVELRKTIKMLKRSQSKMASKLYPDHSREILTDPEEYKKLANAWGDLGGDEY
jgi:hypothetical protein